MGGHRHQIVHSVNGLSCDPEVESLAGLLAQAPTRTPYLGEAACASVVEHFTAQISARRQSEYFRRVLA